jgi:Bacterial transglutaminase-like cysteine proteinase BTLCP
MPDAYDVDGRKVFRPDLRRHGGFKPTFPPGRFLSHPLKYWCSDLNELREFLRTCKYVSDKEQFGRKDYWEPPDQFEETKKGDCEDFALWTWRQLLHLGYAARFVGGRAGRYGDGHAWVVFTQNDKTYLLEPLARRIGPTLPRLSVLTYKPKFSMSCEDDNISYYQHEEKTLNASLLRWASLIAEWAFFWGLFWLRVLTRIPFGNASKMLQGTPAKHD